MVATPDHPNTISWRHGRDCNARPIPTTVLIVWRPIPQAVLTTQQVWSPATPGCVSLTKDAKPKCVWAWFNGTAAAVDAIDNIGTNCVRIGEMCLRKLYHQCACIATPLIRGHHECVDLAGPVQTQPQNLGLLIVILLRWEGC